VILNIILIPQWHYLGAAIATFACYFLMMLVSYSLGQKFYPVPYARKKLIAYLLIVTFLYLLHRGLLKVWDNGWFNVISATALLMLFALFISKIEKKEFQKLPLIGKLYKAPVSVTVTPPAEADNMKG
jgi:O-antigen/teichoic acid export membrane protein